MNKGWQRRGTTAVVTGMKELWPHVMKGTPCGKGQINIIMTPLKKERKKKNGRLIKKLLARGGAFGVINLGEREEGELKEFANPS